MAHCRLSLALVVLSLLLAPPASASPDEGPGGTSLSAEPLAARLQRLAMSPRSEVPASPSPGWREELAGQGLAPDLEAGPCGLAGQASDTLTLEVGGQWLAEPGAALWPDTAVQFGWAPLEDVDLRLQGKVVLVPLLESTPRLPESPLPELKLAGSVPLAEGWSLGLEAGGACVDVGVAAPAGAMALIREGPDGTTVFLQVDGVAPVAGAGWSTILKTGFTWEPHEDLVVNLLGQRDLQAREWTVGLGVGVRF